ncbi:DUF3299 domain-containing protein [Aliivibrio sp. S4TY2]|uniref:DUF3299 domain-containing protein n=1 Tax=unclassified Aliivibrio TaxID=2645654 RepID=UPI002377F950|nr:MULTISPECIES: DUF3299 domain-containing protein [unclassified Aliivibrio]MDD9156635.1 DUF3299 domain-containing protein [Aliivibrio sp. S4TY2]MDD9159928.1 DUF3299 domain-containing protein [Aliivibrio sp. S4TY1]MDD9164150.1 DUF3299 domain-containing protein [Aliivibrio sp. S4MY2]MDD9168342.1 DUF3299 domain-containing protein [Aliivibrio sp. S4MY4]MDD9184678.1 DUF3299 domain-containing protein [Aliivibrio sp. S4MY3]
MEKLLIILTVFSFSISAKMQQVKWQDLKPSVSEETVQLPEVTEEQKQLLASVLYLQQQDDEASKKELDNIILVLESQGLDASKTLQIREKYMAIEKLKAESLNTEISGNKVRMPGFIVPIEFEGIKAIDFLLVPYAGACIHLPPPPANQIVRLSYPEGFEVENVQYPVWVEGIIQADKQTDDVYLVDGETQLTMGYSMKGLKIERYYEE